MHRLMRKALPWAAMIVIGLSAIFAAIKEFASVL